MKVKLSEEDILSSRYNRWGFTVPVYEKVKPGIKLILLRDHESWARDHPVTYTIFERDPLKVDDWQQHEARVHASLDADVFVKNELVRRMEEWDHEDICSDTTVALVHQLLMDSEAGGYRESPEGIRYIYVGLSHMITLAKKRKAQK